MYKTKKYRKKGIVYYKVYINCYKMYDIYTHKANLKSKK